jgi:hypothetical protein
LLAAPAPAALVFVFVVVERLHRAGKLNTGEERVRSLLVGIIGD